MSPVPPSVRWPATGGGKDGELLFSFMQTFLWCMVSNLAHDLTNQVTDLKEALKARGLEGKGTKAVLKERLLQALKEEEEEEEEENGVPRLRPC